MFLKLTRSGDAPIIINSEHIVCMWMSSNPIGGTAIWTSDCESSEDTIDVLETMENIYDQLNGEKE